MLQIGKLRQLALGASLLTLATSAAAAFNCYKEWFPALSKVECRQDQQPSGYKLATLEVLQAGASRYLHAELFPKPGASIGTTAFAFDSMGNELVNCHIWPEWNSRINGTNAVSTGTCPPPAKATIYGMYRP